MVKKFNYVADNIAKLLRNRYHPPEHAYLPQVRNGTGFDRSARTADALVMGLYPSRGLYLHGFEIKVNRQDWLRELKNPDKAEEIAKFCDFWWVVAPKDIVKLDEVPSDWGYMVPQGSTTKIAKQPNQLKPVPIDRLFLAAILRKAQETITPEADIDDAFEKGRKREKSSLESATQFEKANHNALKDKLDVFEEASGIKIDSWKAEDIGNAVKMVLNGDHLHVKKRLENLLETSKKITEGIEEHLKNS